MKKKVSCSIITYNQKDYISKCLEGILKQIVNFSFEIIIGDDNSTDGTREILKDYADKYPGLIRLNLRELKGVGLPGKENFVTTLSMCNGEYIALCDGDDYWTDPLKLQKQADFLDANPDYVLCFHQVSIIKINGEIVDDFITKVPENYETIETLVRLGNYIHTPSVVFRNIIKEFPSEFIKSPIGDFFLYVMLAEHGKLKYLEDIMTVYREGVGVWSDKSIYFRNFNTALVHTYLFNYFSSKENHLISEILLKRIGRFIKNFESQITKDDLMNLSSNLLIRITIFDLLLTNIEQLKKGSIDKKKTGELMQIIFRRVKKGVWKKLGH
jgi:glycosyltransferase involved in cell wall biosynthesis